MPSTAPRTAAGSANCSTASGLRQPENGIAHTVDEVLADARRIGYPVLLRPSYVLGGRAMEIVYDDAMVHDYMVLYAEQMGGHDRQRRARSWSTSFWRRRSRSTST